jgi:hypothetical protein
MRIYTVQYISSCKEHKKSAAPARTFVLAQQA